MEENLNVSDTENGIDITLTLDKPVTKEELFEKACINPDEWIIENFKINTWDSQVKGGGKLRLFQTKLNLKRNVPALDNPMYNGAKILVDKLTSVNGYAHSYLYPDYNLDDDTHLLELSLFDSHFGKLAWSDETGDDDYDLTIAVNLYRSAISELLQKVRGYKIEKIVMPIGSDFLHINNAKNETYSGTSVDTDSRMAKIFATAKQAVIEAIDECASYAPVDLLWVPGNHDRESSYYLMQVLHAWYRDCKDINVDIDPKFRKYYRYGVNLIGFTHGNEEKHLNLPTIMMDEATELGLWDDNIKHKEIHLGHLHKSKMMKIGTVDSYGSTIIRIIPSLCATDAWHYSKGFVKGNKAAEAYLWSKENGYTGHFSVNTKELK